MTARIDGRRPGGSLGCGRTSNSRRHAAVLRTAAWFTIAAAGATATAGPPHVTFTSQFPWPGGYSGSILIQNNDTAPIVNWVLTFTNGPDWSDMWNAVGSKSGSDATIVHAAWNGTIPAGGSVTVGFTGSGVLLQNVVNCKVNGQPATVSYVGAEPGQGSPAILTASLPKAAVGTPYSFALLASGGTPPYTWSLESGALPPGLALGASGTISGTASAAGSWSGAFRVEDAAEQSAVKVLSLVAFAPPTVSIGDASILLAPFDPDAGSGSPGFLSTSGNQIVDGSGRPVRIAGVNWFGFETSTHVVHGLWTRNWKSVLEQVAALGFNTLRIPFSNQMLDPASNTSSINLAANPDLVGLKPIEVLDRIVEHCGVLGLRVILDRHSAKDDNYLNEDLWYIPGDAVYTEERWIADWVMLAARYLGNPTVIGADLFNEPKRTATWGNSAPATDWNKAAERCGDAILAANPDWLIIVEGVEKHAGQNTWWGGNLAGAATHPVLLAAPNRLVYSMHDYPASVWPQPWFSAPGYPSNLPSVWRGFWGYLFEDGIAPLLLGEFGSKLQTTSDQVWLDTLTDYIDGDFDLDGQSDLVGDQRGMSWTYWCLNPNSGDTGGILADDWTSVNANKMDMLAASLAPMIDGAGQPGQEMLFKVALSAPAEADIEVPWWTVDGSAVAGVDYLAGSGVLHFKEGDVSRSIVIMIPPHQAPATRTFQVLLGPPSGAVLGDGVAIGTIVVPCIGDLDGSGAVNGADLGLLLGAWGQSGGSGGAGLNPDLDGSGSVDGADLGMLLAAWGEC